MKFTRTNNGTSWDLPQRYSELTQPERAQVRQQYIRKQNGLCYHCHLPLDRDTIHTHIINWNRFPDGFRNNPVHLHHDHKTDLTLGAVHAYCNAKLWQWHGE
jgi:hypothetical protein